MRGQFLTPGLESLNFVYVAVPQVLQTPLGKLIGTEGKPRVEFP
jgi:hypothetical protein